MASWLVRLSLDRVVWGLSSGQGQCVVFLGKTLYSLHPVVYCKWVPVNLMIVPCNGIAGSRNTPSHFTLQKLG